MSATTSARDAPRATVRVWWSMSSRVTASVLSDPRTTMPTESPTSNASTPAWSSRRAIVASYAVSMAIFSPRAFFSLRSGTRIREGLMTARPGSSNRRKSLREPVGDSHRDVLADVAIGQRAVLVDFTGDGRHEQVIHATNDDHFDRLRLALFARTLRQSLSVLRQYV